MKRNFVFLYLVLSICLMTADTLWDEKFEGYITSVSAFKAGDIITVLINSGFSLELSAVNKDSKSVTFEFRGGEFANLLNFLPYTETGSDRKLSTKEKYALKTEMAVRVTEVDPTGKLLVAGNRTINLAGKQETIILTGRVDPKTIDSSRKIEISKIENTRLTYTSFLDPQLATLTNQDIQEIITELTAPLEGQTTQQRTYQLTEQKKRELLLLYLNRLIDILFR